ncbi:hypothetical protein [Pseudomonas sp. RIT-PI-AD]|uniref:hypothetical protein n=1 Tax=Pseudomonas sp. RIT-PI-AD TaxID=3035294 RepID=UPI0021DA7063|nr:hypothetical protein [Pseudomonas sp. RIT-PI-AD]
MANVFDKATWEHFVRGFTLYDCAIYRSKGYGFVLVEEQDSRDSRPRTRFITMATDAPMEKRFGVFTSGNFGFTSIACSTSPAEYVAVDTRNTVYSANARQKGVESPLDTQADTASPSGGRIVVQKLVRAAGTLYGLGTYRSLYRREGFERWTRLNADGSGLELPADAADNDDYWMTLGFKDLSAFAADDLYAVGGSGDVWRFDGKRWQNCPFPTNAQLETVCCAGDGKVYISDAKGCVWAGRESRWQKVAQADLAWGHQPVDAAWFKGRLYLGAQEGLYTLSGKELVPLGEVDTQAPSAMVSGRLDVSPDGEHLLTAGPHGACLFDGQDWTRLFSTYDFV